MIPFSDDELVEPVKSVLGKQLYILEQDGGGLEFLGVKNGVVFVHLTGACKGDLIGFIFTNQPKKPFLKT